MTPKSESRGGFGKCPTSFLAWPLVLLATREARAGMPSVTITDLTRLRFDAISFFAVCFLLCAWGVQAIWNGLRADFPRLPRLSYRRALGVTTLWGLLFLLVLSMISGARELMTPGAWQKDGLTYKLAAGEPPPVEPGFDPRRAGLERLKAALWTYARSHDGKLPPDDGRDAIPDEAWELPDTPGVFYRYVGGAIDPASKLPLAYEPDVHGDARWVLLADGGLVRMSGEELGRALAGKDRP